MPDPSTVYDWFRPALQSQGYDYALFLASVAWVLMWAESQGYDPQETARQFATLFVLDSSNNLPPIDPEAPRLRITEHSPQMAFSKLTWAEMESAITDDADKARQAWTDHLARYFSPTPPILAPSIAPQPPGPTTPPEMPDEPYRKPPPAPAPAPAPQPQPSLAAEIARAAAISIGVWAITKLIGID